MLVSPHHSLKVIIVILFFLFIDLHSLDAGFLKKEFRFCIISDMETHMLVDTIFRRREEYILIEKKSFARIKSRYYLYYTYILVKTVGFYI